ncbi:hypothetical protein [Halobacterium rubrum]|uniref:hypothetical protein n=1 Tax=Halobacterium rubrum TaxID=1341552 RepID=UPI0024590D89|nr:hypothetical protein [Halobacterium rubrum]MDH5021711.1 hypothetical protein [Halobacterium rubrum]
MNRLPASGIRVIACCLVVGSLITVGVATPAHTTAQVNGISHNESLSLFSRDVDDPSATTETPAYESLVRNSSTESALEYYRDGDIEYAAPPERAETWTENAFQSLPESTPATESTYPEGAELKNGSFIQEAHVTVFSVSPSTVLHRGDEQVRLVGEDATLAAYADARVDLPESEVVENPEPGIAKRTTNWTLTGLEVTGLTLRVDGETVGSSEQSKAKLDFQVAHREQADVTVHATFRANLTKTITEWEEVEDDSDQTSSDESEADSGSGETIREPGETRRGGYTQFPVIGIPGRPSDPDRSGEQETEEETGHETSSESGESSETLVQSGTIEKVVSETVSVEDGISVEGYDISDSLDGAVLQRNGELRRLSLESTTPVAKYSVKASTAARPSTVQTRWRFFTARNTTWETLKTATPSDTETTSRTTVPVTVHAFPSNNSLYTRTYGVQPVTNVQPLYEFGQPATLPEHVNVDAATQPYKSHQRIKADVHRLDRTYPVRVQGLVSGQTATLQWSELSESELRPVDLSLSVIKKSGQQTTLRATALDGVTGEPLPEEASVRTVTIAYGSQHKHVELNEDGVGTVAIDYSGVFEARYTPGVWAGTGGEIVYEHTRATARRTPMKDVGGILGEAIRAAAWIAPLYFVYRLSQLAGQLITLEDLT